MAGKDTHITVLQKNGNLIMAIDEGSKPLKEFMMKQTRQSDLTFFVELKHKTPPQNPEQITKELKRTADELASCDISMQTIRNLIEEK